MNKLRMNCVVTLNLNPCLMAIIDELNTPVSDMVKHIEKTSAYANSGSMKKKDLVDKSGNTINEVTNRHGAVKDKSVNRKDILDMPGLPALMKRSETKEKRRVTAAYNTNFSAFDRFL